MALKHEVYDSKGANKESKIQRAVCSYQRVSVNERENTVPDTSGVLGSPFLPKIFFEDTIARIYEL